MLGSVVSEGSGVAGVVDGAAGAGAVGAGVLGWGAAGSAGGVVWAKAPALRNRAAVRAIKR